jgi:YD repeat-containing protein
VFDFSDRFGIPDAEAQTNTPPVELLTTLKTYAFATKVTNALSQTAYTQYDYYLSKPVNGEDANGLVTEGVYNDALDRPTDLVVNIIAGTTPNTTFQRRTTFSYNDAARMITTQNDQATYGDGVFKSQVLYDGLGRTTETRSYEGTGYITSKQEYDALGRIKRGYNPYRTTIDETYGYAEPTYDGLGRVSRMETFTGAAASSGAVVTSYVGNSITVRDQSGRQRRSLTDALGRLKQVDELNESGTLYATTSYGYDALDNLTHVTQDGQHRYFMYDALSRLIRDRNPEQFVNTPVLDLVDPVTNNSQLCTSYSYDTGGNLQTRIDARNIRTDYGYDDLNRPTSRIYSAPQGVPATAPVNYYYDAQPLPLGAPSFTRGPSTGRLSAVLYGGSASTTGNYVGYDAAGRVSTSLQKTDSQVYQMSYGYNLSGALTSQTYPGIGGTGNGRVVLTEYDAAGRIAGIRDQATASFYAGGAGLNRIEYTVHGAVKAMKLGMGFGSMPTSTRNCSGHRLGLERQVAAPAARASWAWTIHMG